MNTPFETLLKEEQKEWVSAHAEYVVRMKAEKLKYRPFNIWITDFGFTHKEE